MVKHWFSKPALGVRFPPFLQKPNLSQIMPKFSSLLKFLISFYVSLYISIGFFLSSLFYFVGYCYQQFLDRPILSQIEKINPNIDLGNEVLEPLTENIVRVLAENNPEIVCTDLGFLLFLGFCILIFSVK